MIRSVNAAFVGLCAAAFVVARGASASAEQAKLVPVESKVDFGSVSQGDEVPFEFILRNEGDAPLNISNVKPSCGCTAALVSESVVPPGGEARITGTVKTAGFQDRITKTITVTSDDPDQPRTTLTVTGLVQVPFHLEPRYLNFGQVKRGQAEQRVATLTIQDEAKLPVSLGEPTVKNEHVTVTVTPHAGDESGRVFDITVSLSAAAPQGVVATPVLLPIVGETEPLRLSLYANVVGAVALYPQTVSLGLLEDGKQVVRQFVVMSPTRAPFEVVEARCDLPGCTVEVAPADEQNDRRRITVTVDGTGLPDGRVEGTLTVITTVEDGETLSARLVGSVKRLANWNPPKTPTPAAPASQPSTPSGA